MTGLQKGVAGKCALGFVRFGQILITHCDDVVISIQQGRDLDRLARIVGRDQQSHPFD